LVSRDFVFVLAQHDVIPLSTIFLFKFMTSLRFHIWSAIRRFHS
jgi:hypothetical protein